MKNVKLRNGQEFDVLEVIGQPKYIQGQNRDTLTFIFPGTADMAELDAAFSAGNCDSISVTDNGFAYLHSGYAIRAELAKVLVETAPAAGEAAAEYTERVKLVMAQRSYHEAQLAALQDTVDTLVLADLEG